MHFPIIEVRLVNSSASDAMVAQAARVSTTGENELTSDNIEGLINYLLKHKHGSPFEHNIMQFYVKGPIFAFREFHRHRIGFSYNEMSARYMEMPDEFYLPPHDRPLVQTGTSAHPELSPGTPEQYDKMSDILMESYRASWDAYQKLLRRGIARELARAVLPVGIMSQMYVTCNARSLMNFLSLRVDSPDATFPSKPQWEIQQMALQMEIIFHTLMPATYKAYVKNGRVAP